MKKYYQKFNISNVKKGDYQFSKNKRKMNLEEFYIQKLLDYFLICSWSDTS